jgi:predicted alpha/beta-fold hydrolase
MREMLAYVQLKQRHFHDQGQHEQLATLERLGQLTNLRTFWDFDGKVTAPLNGFRWHDYYRRSSSHFFLGQNRTPTADHPFQR